MRAVPTGLDHGTVTAVSGGRGFEVTTLRRDVETDGRHAVVAFTDDWRADAARRDFTINAMSMTRAGEVFDYFGGIADLRAGIAALRRRPGDPHRRGLSAHPAVLPFLRALCGRHRRSGRAGGDPRRRAGPCRAFGRTRVERAGAILSAPDPRAAVGLMAELGVLAARAAGRRRSGAARAPGCGGCPGGSAAAPRGAADRRCRRRWPTRLRLSAAERDRLVALRTGPVPQPGDDDAALRRLLADEARGDADRSDAGLPAATRRNGRRCGHGWPRSRVRCFRWRAATCWRSANRRARASAPCCARCGSGGWMAAVSRTRRRAARSLCGGCSGGAQEGKRFGAAHPCPPGVAPLSPRCGACSMPFVVRDGRSYISLRPTIPPTRTRSGHIGGPD